MRYENHHPPSVDEDPKNRPGVPMETRPHPLQGSHWVQPEQQAPTPGTVHRAEIEAMTPVFGTNQPLKGLSGVLRRSAYAMPETRAKRWMLLLLADRVDVLEARALRLGKSFGIAAVLGFAAWGAINKLRAT
jgi:hypothetical protein